MVDSPDDAGGARTGQPLTKALVATILRHAEDYPWRMQEIGLMGLRLDDRREHRLHVWDPTGTVGEPVIHDHPYRFRSTVVAGELTDTSYAEDGGGEEYLRFRYRLPHEDRRRSDRVRLAATSRTLTEGEGYERHSHELHASHQLPGTVTVIRCAWDEPRELTVCVRNGSSWPQGQARAATRAEIKRFAATALEWF